jgi:hypothetical protein
MNKSDDNINYSLTLESKTEVVKTLPHSIHTIFKK